MLRLERISAPSARFAVCWLSAGILELPFLAAVIPGRALLPAWAAAAAHLAASAVMFFAPPRGRGWTSPLRHWGEPMALWTLVLPGFGWLIMGVLWRMHDPREQKESRKAEELLEEDYEPAYELPGAPDGVQRRLLEAADIMPATDILLGSDPTLKRGAIETLAKIRTPQAIEWLLKARTDPDPEVRFYATSSLTCLKRDYESRVRMAEREVFSRPADSKAQLALQIITQEYAASGLVDARQRRDALGRCCRQLRELTADSAEALELLFRIEIEVDPAAALIRVDELLERLPDEKPRWLKEKANLLFRLGRCGEVRSLLREIREKGWAEEGGANAAEDLGWRTALLWWGA